MADDGSSPASPDVLEEMEDELMNMLEEAAEADAEAEPEPAAEPDRLANGAKDIIDNLNLDPEVADALEAELFGGIDAALDASLPSPDLSETELFGPEDEESTTKAAGSVETEKGEEAEAGEEAERQAAEAPADAPDSAAAQDREARREADEGPYDPKTSRYTRDAHGNLLHKWKVDYAPRGGGGRAQCKDNDCLERHDQGGVRTIEKGCLRIARRVLMDQDSDGNGGTIHLMWYHARCMFNSFLRARKSTRTIESEFDIEGFDELKHEDKELLRRIIDGNESARNVRFRTFDDGGPVKTPQKRSADGDGSDPLGSNGTGGKRRKTQERTLNIGDRVWTFFRCLPKDTGAAGPPGAAVAATKSAKSELAMVRDDVTVGHVIVQFESTEHEKERLELYMSKRGKRIRGWLRYPRLFDGKKQRVPVNWIQFNRDPPALCGCKVQAWGHPCECGITCNRGSAVKVFGVGDIPV